MIPDDDHHSRPRRGALGRALRKVGRGLRNVFDALDFLYFLAVVGRLIPLPFRLLARAFDAFF
jgi:hypothetical protein